MPSTARQNPASKKPNRHIATKAKTQRAASPKKRGAPADAIRLLKADHANVDALFKRYEKARAEQKQVLALKICQELKIHTQIEEEIFYPELREAAKASDKVDDLLDEAKVEHTSAKNLIAELEAGSPGDELYDAKVKVLGEYIRHHVKEEHRDIFPIARKRLDIKEVGDRLAQRKAELMEGGRDAGVVGRLTSTLRH